jgi:hypothetical protein
MAAAPARTAAPPVVELPVPTGPYPVATTSWRLTDRSRSDTFAGARGRVVSMNGRDGKFLQGIQDVFAEWNAEDETMAGVTRATGDEAQVRCRAGLNLHGIPQYGTMIDASMLHPFLMVYSERPGRAGASDPIYRRAAHPYYRVDVKDDAACPTSERNRRRCRRPALHLTKTGSR